MSLFTAILTSGRVRNNDLPFVIPLNTTNFRGLFHSFAYMFHDMHLAMIWSMASIYKKK